MSWFLNPLYQQDLSILAWLSDVQNVKTAIDQRQYHHLNSCSFEILVDFLVLSGSPLENYAMCLGDHLMNPTLKNMACLIPLSELVPQDQEILTVLLDTYFKELSRNPGYEFIAELTYSLHELHFPFIATFVKTWNQYLELEENDPRLFQLFFAFCDVRRTDEVLLLLSQVCSGEREGLWPQEITRPVLSVSSDEDSIYYELAMAVFNFILSSSSIDLPPIGFLEHLFNEDQVDFTILLDALVGEAYLELKGMVSHFAGSLEEKRNQANKSYPPLFFREAFQCGYNVGVNSSPVQ